MFIEGLAKNIPIYHPQESDISISQQYFLMIILKITQNCNISRKSGGLQIFSRKEMPSYPLQSCVLIVDPFSFL